MIVVSVFVRLSTNTTLITTQYMHYVRTYSILQSTHLPHTNTLLYAILILLLLLNYYYITTTLLIYY